MKTRDQWGRGRGRVRLCGSVCDMSMNVCWCIHDLYLDTQAIKSLGTNNLLQDSDPLSLLLLPASGDRSKPAPAFISSVGVLQEDGESQHLPALPERDAEQVLPGLGLRRAKGPGGRGGLGHGTPHQTIPGHGKPVLPWKLPWATGCK